MNSNEYQLGIAYVKKLTELHTSAKVISIGQHSNRLLNEHEIENSPLPHPANGGNNNFKKAMRQLPNRLVY
jgi:hypothetical protein